MFVNSGTRGNKFGVMGSLSVSPPLPPSLVKPGTRREGLSREVPKKSFGINNWHSLGRGEKAVVKEKSGKDSRVAEWWKKESIFGRRCCKNVDAKRQKKGGLEKIFKKMNAKYFV